MKTHNFVLAANDTDSISFRKPDGAEFTNAEQQALIEEINVLMPDMIEYEHDGYYENVLVIKTKNYVLQEKGSTKLKKKGSSITDKKREPALLELQDAIISDLIKNEGKSTTDIFERYIREAKDIQDINRWSIKKSVTKAVLNPTRTNEQKVLDALKDRNPREGDKFWMYNAIDGQKQKIVKGEPQFYKKSGEPMMVDNTILRCVDEWDGSCDTMHYVERVYDTMKIFKNVLDLDSDKFIKYHLAGNTKLLEKL